MTKASLPSPVDAAIRRVVLLIPRGRVLPYSTVAMLAGLPRGARRVAKAMKSLEGVPWWRVLRADLTLAPQVRGEQSKRLRTEGVPFTKSRVSREARISVGEMVEKLEQST